MEPAVNTLLESQPGVTRKATFEDLLWAYSVFWSRGQSLPVPNKPGSGVHGAWLLISAGLVLRLCQTRPCVTLAMPATCLAPTASQLLASDPQADAHALLEVQEGIVPGLDFCNHHLTAPKCWWEVVVPRTEAQSSTAPASASNAPPQSESSIAGKPPALVQLRLHAGARVKPGEELLISYGDKSNEELLMLYGFAVPGNPHDHVMLHCPLPPASTWDTVMHARMELVRVRVGRKGVQRLSGSCMKCGKTLSALLLLASTTQVTFMASVDVLHRRRCVMTSSSSCHL